jgi:membrane protein
MTDPEKPSTAGKIAAARQRVDAVKEKVETVASAERARRKTVQAAFRLFDTDRRTGGSLLAGGLAYRIFLFALPFALFMSSLARIFGADAAANLLGDAGMGAGITSTVDEAARSTGRAAPVLLILSFILMLWTAQSTWKALLITSELAWGLRPERPLRRPQVALIAAASMMGLSLYHYLLRPLYAGGPVTDLFASGIASVGLTALWLWGARALPRPAEVPWTYLVPGAVLFGFGIELLRLGTAVFLSGKFDRSVDLYGALGIGAAIMAVLYLIGRLTVTAVFANASWWRTRTGTGQTSAESAGGAESPGGAGSGS